MGTSANGVARSLNLDVPPGADGTPPRVVVVSYRLGGADGVSVEAAKWVAALGKLGCSVTTVAGEGEAAHVDPGLGAGNYVTRRIPPLPDEASLRSILALADLVVVENLFSLPLNSAAASVVAHALAGRPALIRHHDLPWQRAAFRAAPPPPNDPAWCHVVTTERSRLELRARGLRRAAGLGDDVLYGSVNKRRLGEPGAHGIDRDPRARQLQRQRAGQTNDAMFGRAIGRNIGVAGQTGG